MAACGLIANIFEIFKNMFCVSSNGQEGNQEETASDFFLWVMGDG